MRNSLTLENQSQVIPRDCLLVLSTYGEDR